MNIYAKILKDSICGTNRLTTFEVQLPKVLLAELNTHRILSKNFQSSRALPNKAAVEVESFEPLFFGKNQSGMQAKDEEIYEVEKAKEIWNSHIEASKAASINLAALKLHKQWTNRPNDWHTMAKGVISGTEWKNFRWLRNHSDAQPEFHELASQINFCLNMSEPQVLNPGEYHLPYVWTERDSNGRLTYRDFTDTEIDIDTAIKLSVSCCAQVSYRQMNETLEKAISIYDKLNINSPSPNARCHVSPLEHVGTPIDLGGIYFDPITWEEGVTHIRRDGSVWSGNFQGWIQYRQLIPNNTVW